MEVLNRVWKPKRWNISNFSIKNMYELFSLVSEINIYLYPWSIDWEMHWGIRFWLPNYKL